MNSSITRSGAATHQTAVLEHGHEFLENRKSEDVASCRSQGYDQILCLSTELFLTRFSFPGGPLERLENGP